MSTPEALTNAAIVIAGVIVLMFAAFLGYLHYRNKHPPPATPAKPRPVWLEVSGCLSPFCRVLRFVDSLFTAQTAQKLIVFVEYFLIELIGIVFTVFAVIDLESVRESATKRGKRGFVMMSTYVIVILFTTSTTKKCNNRHQEVGR